MFLLQVLATALVGAMGWWVTHFFLEPIQKFASLRRQAQLEILTVHEGRAEDPADREVGKERKSTYRQLGRDLLAFHITADRWTKWWLQQAGYDLESGTNAFSRIGNKDGHGPDRKASQIQVSPEIVTKWHAHSN